MTFTRHPSIRRSAAWFELGPRPVIPAKAGTGRRCARALRAGSVGFTLIEIMIVVVILGILAAVIVPNVMDRPDMARVAAAKQDIAQISQALKLYRLDNQAYPSTDQGLQALIAKPATNPVPGNWRKYLERLPKDPWGNDYQYLNPGVKGEFDVFSLGADKAPGGEGNNADIGNWNL